MFSCTDIRFHDRWHKHWFQLTLTLEHISSRALTSSAEQDCIETIYGSCKDCTLAQKVQNRIHTLKFEERKVSPYSFA